MPLIFLDRSPWSNEYDPPLDDGFLPPDELRAIEFDLNEVFDGYRQLYIFFALCFSLYILIDTLKVEYLPYTSGSLMMVHLRHAFSLRKVTMSKVS